MSIDKETSPETRTFIQQGFYVNERVTSSMEIAGLELIANELGPVFWRYGFNVKYVLKSYQSKGVTTSSNTEGFLGLLWDFFRDELIPTLDVYLCAKSRDWHMEEALGLDTIKDCIITARTVLITGCLYNLSGRFIGPLIMKVRLIYSFAVKQKLGWDASISTTHTEITKDVHQLLMEILEIKQTLKPLKIL